MNQQQRPPIRTSPLHVRKDCSKCGINKHHTEFYIKRRVPKENFIQLQQSSWCKQCTAKKSLESWYSKPREEQVRIQRIKYDRSRTTWLDFFKETLVLSCNSCGYDKCFAALEFHHIDASKKEFSIGWAMNALSPSEKNKEIMSKELIKCEILCANCHREHHNE